MTLVAAALAQEPGTCEGFLHAECGEDPDLYAEVTERVEWERRMAGFLSRSVITSFEFLDRPFEPGDLIADRFRIGDEIGRGGMGVVYEAFDEKLNRRVAIKSAQAGYDHWLPPEVRAAREVSHFNVCKVHDLHSARTDLGEVEFLTMEFIEGETLSARIHRAGPLPAEQARDIARQICAGLGQAHRQGVIHGDLKCGNIILTHTPEGGTRAVITDFGLAALSVAGEQRVLNRLAGSLDYMAPELFARAPVSAASDLYALGIIIHVMLTGRVPDPVEEPPLAESASTETLPQDAPARYFRRRVGELGTPWKRVVCGCLKLRPEDRFGSAEEVIRQIDSYRPRRKWLMTIPAAAAVILGSVLWLGREMPGPPVRLAILPVTVEGAPLPTAEGLGVELADRLSGARRGFIVIPPSESRRNRVDTPEKAKSVLAATHVLRTRVQNGGGSLAVQASVVDTSSGVPLQELRGTYAAKDIAVLAKALTATVTGAFRLRARVPMDVLAAAAYPAYVQGLNLLRRDESSADEAIPFLQQAAQLDSLSALPYAALAEAYLQKARRNFGSEWMDRASQALTKAQSLNPDSAPVLLAAGYLKQLHGLYDEAARDYARAVEIAPESVDAWNRLALAYASLNRADQAIATYQRALQAQPDYYLPYIDFGRFYQRRLQFAEAEQLFRRVTVIAPGLALGHMLLGLLLQQENRLPEAEQAMLTSVRLQETVPALVDLGVLCYQEERYADAAQYFARSLSVGPPRAVGYSDLGDAYRHLGRFEDAATNYRAAEALAKSDVTQNPSDPFARSVHAYALAYLRQGDLANYEIAQALVMGRDDARVRRQAVFVLEALQEREQTLAVLRDAPFALIEELNRHPELRSLQQDSHFQELLNIRTVKP